MSDWVKVSWDNYLPLFLVFFFFVIFCIISRFVSLWRQKLSNSFFEFNVQRSGLNIRKNFSHVHNWHYPVTWLITTLTITTITQIFQLRTLAKAFLVPYMKELYTKPSHVLRLKLIARSKRSTIINVEQSELDKKIKDNK